MMNIGQMSTPGTAPRWTVELAPKIDEHLRQALLDEIRRLGLN